MKELDEQQEKNQREDIKKGYIMKSLGIEPTDLPDRNFQMT
jgi:hypothetical protein